MAATLSREPAPWGCARFTKDAMTTTTKTPARAMTTILAGGRLRFAVPNSSAMLMVGPDALVGGTAGTGGGLTGFVFETPGGTLGFCSGIRKSHLGHSTLPETSQSTMRQAIRRRDYAGFAWLRSCVAKSATTSSSLSPLFHTASLTVRGMMMHPLEAVPGA